MENVSYVFADPTLSRYNILPRRKSMLDVLSARESGFCQSHNFASEFSKAKYRGMTCTGHCFQTPFEGNCKLMKQNPAGDSFVALYTGNNSSSIYDISFTFRNRVPEGTSSVQTFRPDCRQNLSGFIEYICKAGNDIFYVSNDLGKNNQISNTVSYFPCDFYRLPPPLKLESEGYFFCCAGTENGSKLAIGARNRCILYDSFSQGYYFIPVHGDAISTALSKSANILCCGDSKYFSRVCDFRQRSSIAETPIHPYPPRSAWEIAILENEKSMVVSDGSESLFKVIFNELDPVVRYEGHSSYGRRTPLSLSEDFDLLCATGSDDITRVWSLSTGKLLQAMYPPFRDLTVHSSIIANGNKWCVAMLQGCALLVVEPHN